MKPLESERQNLKLSVILPVYKNEQHLRILHSDLTRVLGELIGSGNYEILLVDDGSPDHSWAVIRELCQQDSHVVGLRLSRNFGQHHAITAGIDRCKGQWALVMDADGQDSPDFIPQLWAEIHRGFDVVSARRVGRADAWWRSLVSKIYRNFFQFLSGLNYDGRIANYRIISRTVIDSMKEIRESFRSFPLHVHWLGFRTSVLDIPHHPRISGKSGYTVFKLFAMALDVAVAYSNKPLKISVAIGGIISAVTLFFMSGLVLRAWLYAIPVPGWASLIASVWFFSGLILANLGVLGIYIGQILTESRGRPLYVVQQQLNGSSSLLAPPHEAAPTK